MRLECFDASSPFIEPFRVYPEALYAGDPWFNDGERLPSEADARFFLALDTSDVLGRLATIINPAISYKGEKTGCIGWFECEEDPRTAEALFNAAATFLREQGCVWAVGPMNGTTWNKYRVTEPSALQPFFLDNYHKPWYGGLFQANGFIPVARYLSTKNAISPGDDPRIVRFEHQLGKRGITVRQIDLERFEEEIGKIFGICTKSFVNNFLYSTVSWNEFRLLYGAVRPLVDPSLVLLAEDQSTTTLGFVFALPNFYEKPVMSGVIKTVAVLPHSGARGLGTYLVARIHQALGEKGYTSVFHALMHEANISTNILAGGGETYHRYILFGKKL